MQDLMSFHEDVADPRQPESENQGCRNGAIAEMELALEAMKRGFHVFMPFGHAQKADIILWMPPAKPITVQIKKATFQRPSPGKRYARWKFMVGSGKPIKGEESGYTKYKDGDFDILCGYIEERKSFAFYKLRDIAGISAITWSAGISPENNWHIFDLG